MLRLLLNGEHAAVRSVLHYAVALRIADLIHAPVRVDLEASEEAVGVFLQRPQGVAAAVLGERDAEHALLDPETVHLVEQEPNRVVARLGVGHVLEHVLRRELELVERLVVPQALPQELVRPRTGAKGCRDHQIDHTDVGRHGHTGLLGTGLDGTAGLPERSDPYGRVRELRAVRRFAPEPARMGP